ncbi:MAG: hypothetical protein KDA24_11730, partial [Deltaproteobacteria bacterium]|nr:hypothetical protein [Deltaproteobacteria bacterium]
APVKEPAPAAASGEPGRLKVGANSPFELSIAHRRYTQLQAGRGIDLEPGSYRIRLDCIRCPEGTDPLQVDVEVKSGEETRRVLTFGQGG